jgi:hypothetical protein
MPHETIEDSWNDLLSKMPEAAALPSGNVAAARHAFYAGTFATYRRFCAAASRGPRAVQELMDETQAELNEYAQRLRHEQ